MAQYDLVFIKNDASSGVSYNEFKLQKPPGAGYSLTQHPTTGILSWVQSMNNGGTVSVDFNNYTETGYYIIPNTGTFANEPKYNDGVLQVFKAPSGVIYQTAYVKPVTNSTDPTTFVRHFRPGSPGVWTNWAAMELVYQVPTRPIEDSRAPYSEDAEGSIAASVQAIENALMEHTFEHVKNYGLVTVLVSAWTAEDTDLFEATVEVLGVLTTDAVDCIPDNASVDAINEAEFYPSVNVEADYIHIYAKRVPSKSVNFFVRIIKS